MRVPELRRALVAIALASGSSCGAPQGPEPRGTEPRSTEPPRTPGTAAPSGSALAAPLAPTAAPALPPAPPPSAATAADNRPSSSAPSAGDHAGPGEQTSWMAALVGEDRRQRPDTCPAGKAISTGCHVPEAIADRRARASQPVSACPRTGAVSSIPCGGCAPLFRKAADGSLLTATTEAERATTPSACCYAACVPIPPPMPPNAGRPLLVGGRLRLAPLVRLGR
jgi:hypothetical protein